MNCPSCQRPVFSRQHRKCGYCEHELPKELLLSPDEIAAMKAEQAEIAVRRAVAKEEEEQERKKQAATSARIDVGSMPQM